MNLYLNICKWNFNTSLQSKLIYCMQFQISNWNIVESGVKHQPTNKPNNVWDSRRQNP